MARTPILVLALGLGAVTLVAAQQPPSLAQAQPGLWEISGMPGAKTPARQCIGDVTALARFEHRSKACTAKVLKNAGGAASIEYSCGGAGFGHSEVDVLTPRSLRINTQGISDGLPFNYVLQARRVGECPKITSVTSH